MSTSGGQPGNNNAGNGKRYRKALERALAHKYGSVDDGLLAVAAKRVEKAEEGDNAALDHIADRFDGKPHQSIGTDSEHGPLQVHVTATENRL